MVVSADGGRGGGAGTAAVVSVPGRWSGRSVRQAWMRAGAIAMNMTMEARRMPAPTRVRITMRLEIVCVNAVDVTAVLPDIPVLAFLLVAGPRCKDRKS
jgi:hypothetical protein